MWSLENVESLKLILRSNAIPILKPVLLISISPTPNVPMKEQKPFFEGCNPSRGCGVHLR